MKGSVETSTTEETVIVGGRKQENVKDKRERKKGSPVKDGYKILGRVRSGGGVSKKIGGVVEGLVGHE